MEKIPEQLPFDGLRIVIFGPESSGKSTLAHQLGHYFREPVVDEYARDYLQNMFDANGHICDYEDVMPIAIGHRKAENLAVKKARKLLICDTDLLETYIYSMIYYDKVPRQLVDSIKQSHYDHYLLMDVNTPWVKDDLRDKPYERKEMFDRFENTLKKNKLSYSKISGLGVERFKDALAVIENM